MKERGMIFNAEMVRAVLEGSKTQTRRIMKVQPVSPELELSWIVESTRRIEDGKFFWREPGSFVNNRRSVLFYCPFGAVGDRLWVRETWNKYGGLLTYRADHDWINEMRKATVCPAKWTPSIHMPRWASRITLEITGVRVERLNSISEEDAQAEGMELTGWRPTYSDPDSGGDCQTPYDNFADLWSSIYGEESWQANPFVWVIEFKRVEVGSDD